MKKTVLIVDDNPTLLYFTARNLQRELEGVEIVTATSCEQAREAVTVSHPAVVVADLNLTDGNGKELVEEMARRFPEMAAILVSGEEIPSSCASNLFGCLIKPYDAEALVRLVTNALAGGAQSVSHAQSFEPAQCEGYDRHGLQNRLACLLAGLRAFGADLAERSHDPAEVSRTLDEYLDRLCATIVEVSRQLPVCPVKYEKGNGASKKRRSG